MTLSLLQGFSYRETNFYFCQFFSNFLKYSFSNFLLSYSYNIFTVYFSSNFPLLKFFSSIISNFSCHLTSVLILSLNSFITSLVFPRSFFLFHISYSAINLFHHTKYFATPCHKSQVLGLTSEKNLVLD